MAPTPHERTEVSFSGADLPRNPTAAMKRCFGPGFLVLTLLVFIWVCIKIGDPNTGGFALVSLFNGAAKNKVFCYQHPSTALGCPLAKACQEAAFVHLPKLFAETIGW